MAFSRTGGSSGSGGVDTLPIPPPPTDDYGCDVWADSGSTYDINAAIATIASVGGTVCVPEGDWTVDQEILSSYGVGGAIPINLEDLPSGVWLNIIGKGGTGTVTTNNGETIANAPKCVLRCSEPITGPLANPIATFGIRGSDVDYPSNFNFVNSIGKHIRISGFTILGNITTESGVVNSGNIGIDCHFVDGFLVDNCVIDSCESAGVMSVYSHGLVCKSTIADLYHRTCGGTDGYGVQVGGNFGFYSNSLGDPTWGDDMDDIYSYWDWQALALDWQVPIDSDYAIKGSGTIPFHAGPVYVEDSTFLYNRHPITSSSYGFWCFRHNTCRGGVGIQMCDMHGGGPSVAANSYAARGGEFYDNNIYGVTATYGTGTYGLGLRGAGAIITDNVFNDLDTAVGLGNENYDAGVPAHPEYVNDTYIWDNTYNAVGTNLSVQAGVNIVLNTNYWLAGLGGYVKYTYPHPWSP